LIKLTSIVALIIAPFISIGESSEHETHPITVVSPEVEIDDSKKSISQESVLNED
jgi:hypothetical protein